MKIMILAAPNNLLKSTEKLLETIEAVTGRKVTCDDPEEPNVVTIHKLGIETDEPLGIPPALKGGCWKVVTVE